MEKQMTLNEIIETIEEFKKWYPEIIFGKDWSSEELKKLAELIESNTDRTLDSLSAYYGRVYADDLAREFKMKMSGDNNAW